MTAAPSAPPTLPRLRPEPWPVTPFGPYRLARGGGNKLIKFPSIGDRVIRWIERNCVFTDGQWLGRQVRLLPWQKQLIIDLFEMVWDADLKRWRRRYRTALIGVPKKQGKTELAAFIALWFLLASGQMSPGIAVAAAAEYQADLVFGAAANKRAGRDAVEQASVILDAEMAKGPVTIRYSRRGVAAETVLNPVSGCASQVELLAGGKLNAWADGRHILIGEALLDASRTDDALAFVIAHELAHNVLRATAGEAHSRVAEFDADHLALSLVRGAGYDAAGALATWKPYFYRAGASSTHPAPDARVAAIASGIADER
mgnify:CR=1 FL=1